MSFKLALVFSAALFPFVFLLLDIVVRSNLKMSLEDLGPDLALLGCSLCLARLVELIEVIVTSSETTIDKPVYGIHWLLFLVLLLISLASWVICLGFIKWRVGERWEYIGGADVPLFLSGILGLASSTFFTVVYATSRILL